MPPMRIEVLEHADPEAPYGLKGVGEPPEHLHAAGRRRRAARRHRARAGAHPGAARAPRRARAPEEALRRPLRRALRALAVGRARRPATRGPFAGVDDLHAALVAARARGAARAPARARPRPPRAGGARGAGRRADRGLGGRAGVGGPRPPDRRGARALARAQRAPTASASASRSSSACASTRRRRSSRGARSGSGPRPPSRRSTIALGEIAKIAAPAPGGARVTRSPPTCSTPRAAGRPRACRSSLERATGDGWELVGSARDRRRRRARATSWPTAPRRPGPLPPHLRHRRLLPRPRRGASTPRSPSSSPSAGRRAPPRAAPAQPVRLQHLPRELDA